MTSNNHIYNHLLLHIPHSATQFPTATSHTLDDLNEGERRLIDYYTDQLFIPQQPSAQVEDITFKWCRLYCDVERLPHDPLEREGLGIVHDRWVDGEHRYYGGADSYATYMRHHYEAALRLMQRTGNQLLIDCHSFSELPNPLNEHPRNDVDICIGFNDDETRPSDATLAGIVDHFGACGYRVALNDPFSNSKTFVLPTPFHYHSVMIEVSKRLYMDEATLEKTAGFYTLQRDLQALYPRLLA